eukprot:CAMPEP_0177246382 /NCGR_PEP_ID=MMETSP0367-20130122/50976_1 /TAXON_ID=447022 ORGANISM="Scrippsiella hangoei-like, Strain SHHI-4" /NCGR_SAMPLE_ID=MMETSP0367 /ASSEMBLY_ACC=CAM_ASM_000362 /LENGTH=581 /DNA_ID=CAMNT_0018698391 /DNA_START=75 /DNA_END=1819 /DNA_ORIENTATION=+
MTLAAAAGPVPAAPPVASTARPARTMPSTSTAPPSGWTSGRHAVVDVSTSCATLVLAVGCLSASARRKSRRTRTFSQLHDEASDAAEPPRRRRGRPRKEHVHIYITTAATTATEDEASDAVEPPRRPRGRPRKESGSNEAAAEGGDSKLPPSLDAVTKLPRKGKKDVVKNVEDPKLGHPNFPVSKAKKAAAGIALASGRRSSSKTGDAPSGGAARRASSRRSPKSPAKSTRCATAKGQDTIELPGEADTPALENDEDVLERWRELDAFHDVRPGETTLYVPARAEPEDRNAAMDLALKQAAKLVLSGGWRFRAVFDTGSRLEHMMRLQEFVPDVLLLFERFGVQIAPLHSHVSDSVRDLKASADCRSEDPPLHHGLILVRSPGNTRDPHDSAYAQWLCKNKFLFHLVLIELGGFEPEWPAQIVCEGEEAVSKKKTKKTKEAERIEQWKVVSEAFDTAFKVRAVGLPGWPEHDDTPKRSPQHIGGGVIQVLGSRGTKSLGGAPPVGDDLELRLSFSLCRLDELPSRGIAESFLWNPCASIVVAAMAGSKMEQGKPVNSSGVGCGRIVRITAHSLARPASRNL